MIDVCEIVLVDGDGYLRLFLIKVIKLRKTYVRVGFNDMVCICVSDVVGNVLNLIENVLERMVVVLWSMLYNGCNEFICWWFVGGEELDSVDDVIRW